MASRISKKRSWIAINRAPVLTLWAAVVAERMGFNRDEALTLGRAVAGLNAYSKGKSLGIFRPSRKTVKETRKELKQGKSIQVELLNRAVPATRTKDGLRAVSKGKPESPESVDKYLHGKFGDALGDTRKAMTDLAKAYPPRILSECAYHLYEKFRPDIPAGKKGWGAKGRLSLAKIRKAAESDACKGNRVTPALQPDS
jgi:hypothetical protein